MANVTVGQFSLNPVTGALTGPADYLAERGNARVEAILSGDRDPVFVEGYRQTRSVEQALLVSLQTDYAGWKGARDFAARAGR